VIRRERSDVGFKDARSFSVVDYRHAHSYVVVRGFPALDDEAPGGSPLRVLDFFFAGASRIAAWKDLGAFEIRHPSEAEARTLHDRIGELRAGESLFLLEAGSIESYIVAARVYWAEFEIAASALSPLAADDEEYRQANPPVGDLIRFAD
jgi:hypothetical protein